MRHSGKVTTVQEAMNANAPSLGTFQREKGRTFTESLIMAWLVYLNGILNLNKPMTQDQIELCAVEINNEFYGLKMSDLTLLFRRIISGVYGEFYESLSIPKVLTYFREYMKEREIAAEAESEARHNDFKSNDEFNYSSNVKRIYQTQAKGFRKG